MSDTYDFDDEAARRIEALYTTPDVVATRVHIQNALDLRTGERILDIGSGPALLVQDMARTVGSEGRVCGIDVSEPMLEMGRRRCAGQPWVEFQAADALDLPYPDAAFDAAVSTQVYEYVADIPAALAELFRVLRPGGRAVIMDTDFDSLVLHTEDRARMDRVMAAWNEHFVHRDLPRKLGPHLRLAGFALGRRDALPIFNPEYHANTFGHGFVNIVSGFVAGRAGVSEQEARAWAAEQAELGRRGEFFFSLNRYIFTATKPAAA